MIASLPMYPVHPDAVRALWQAIATGLRQAGVANVPSALVTPDDLITHWRRPDLLLSQACGYPLVTELDGAVRVVGAFRYTAPGCNGIRYRSQIIGRRTDPGISLADFRGRRAAFNGKASQSGYNSFRALVAPLAIDGRFFGAVVETGAHAASMRAVAEGSADIAAIDCVSFAQIGAVDAELRRALKVIGETASAPGLPLVTRAGASTAKVDVMRSVLHKVVNDPALAGILSHLLIDGFEPIERAAYEEIRAMEREAIAAGYPELG